jgi:hypothetical protein
MLASAGSIAEMTASSPIVPEGNFGADCSLWSLDSARIDRRDEESRQTGCLRNDRDTKWT